MKYGARNQITAKVTSIQRGDVMSMIKFEVAVPTSMASVITTESLDDLSLKTGESVRLVLKAIHVLPVKDGTSRNSFLISLKLPHGAFLNEKGDSGFRRNPLCF